MGEKRERRRFTREFKIEAVRQVLDGRTRRAVAEELGLNANLLGRWIKQFRADSEQVFPGHGKLKDRDKEMEELRRENARLKGELSFLKKSLRLLRKRPAVKFPVIEQHRDQYPARWMCSALSVSERGLRSWRSRRDSKRRQKDRRLLIGIRSSFEESERTYGSPRILNDLLEDGQRTQSCLAWRHHLHPH